jgi:CRP-like cAMP-binding protein
MLGMLKMKSWLNSHYEFLTEEDLEFFRPHLVERSLGRDELILTEGRCCRQMSFVISGAFRMFYLSDGSEINAHFFIENDFMVDFDSFLRQTPSKYSIQALEKSRIVSFDHEVLWAAYDRSKNWERFGRLMAQHCSTMVTERLEKFLFMDGTGRYLRLMEDNPRIFDRVPLYHLASYLGMERESLSRIRNKITRGCRL